MQTDTLFVFGLIAVAAAAMASNRIRFDIIALLVVIVLMLSGVLSVSEALAGFGSPVVMLVAGLLVVGEMLDRTGVAADHRGAGASPVPFLVGALAGNPAVDLTLQYHQRHRAITHHGNVKLSQVEVIPQGCFGPAT